MNRSALLALSCLLSLCMGSARAEALREAAPPLIAQPEAGGDLAAENARLRARLEALEACTLSREDVLRTNLLRLQNIEKDVKPQRQTMADFEGYIRWMSGSLSSYSRYVEAGSAAAALAKFLPIPYAGQAGMFAKFVAHFALSLNAASNAVEKYLKTSQQFVSLVEPMDAKQPLNAKVLADVGRFADEQLLKDMTDVQAKLSTTSDLSASALAFLEGMNQYLASTDQYWNKTKQLVTRKEADLKEKSFLTESVQNLKTQAATFNARLQLFDASENRTAPLIKSLVAYQDLIGEIDTRMARRAP